MREYTVDAKDQPLGRVATRVAYLLQGKEKPDYAPHKEGGVGVVVKNAHLVKVSGRKAEQKVYYRHSGKPGNLKKISYRGAFEKSPEWVIRHAVSGMLPKNRLRSRRMRMLRFE